MFRRPQGNNNYAILPNCTSFVYDAANKLITVDMKYYAVTYHGDTVNTTYVFHGGTANQPSDPAKDGYIFIGWGKDENSSNVFDFTTPITEITDLYPLWRAPHSHNEVSFGNVLTADGGTLSAGSYYLTEDVNLTADLVIDGTVDLCLNGYTLTGTGTGSVIKVNNGGTLNLYDCSEKNSGTITGGNSSSYGAGIYLAGTTTNDPCILNMYGGSIKGNITTSYGGGVALKGKSGQNN